MLKTARYHNIIGLKWQLHNDLISRDMQFYQKKMILDSDIKIYRKNVLFLFFTLIFGHSMYSMIKGLI